jgi:hypothetical protein
VAIPLAAGVLAPWGIVLHPAVGAILLSASTLIVAVNAQLRMFNSGNTISSAQVGLSPRRKVHLLLDVKHQGNE